MKLQPDFQFVWNQAFNSQIDRAMLFQLQLGVAWCPDPIEAKQTNKPRTYLDVEQTRNTP